jgi:hypothetical protein
MVGGNYLPGMRIIFVQTRLDIPNAPNKSICAIGGDTNASVSFGKSVKL